MVIFREKCNECCMWSNRKEQILKVGRKKSQRLYLKMKKTWPESLQKSLFCFAFMFFFLMRYSLLNWRKTFVGECEAVRKGKRGKEMKESPCNITKTTSKIYSQMNKGRYTIPFCFLLGLTALWQIKKC